MLQAFQTVYTGLVEHLNNAVQYVMAAVIQPD